MVRTIHDEEGCVHFITFSCYRKRPFLDDDAAKFIVIRVLASQLPKQDGRCAGFVVMPDHVHALVWFTEPGQLSLFMKQWKQRSSFNIKGLHRKEETRLPRHASASSPVWQAGYYDFNVYSPHKVIEKLEYIHNNPVRAGLVRSPCDWRFSSACHYERGVPVGAPITPCS